MNTVWPERNRPARHKPRHNAGMTLIELLILLAVVFVVVVIALPTLKPVRSSDVERFARKHLKYLYERERAYFLQNAHYQSFTVLAQPENGGPFLDRRYTGTEYRERGVIFRGPQGETSHLVLTAELPGGERYFRIDTKGNITEHKGKPSTAAGSPKTTPEATASPQQPSTRSPSAPSSETPEDATAAGDDTSGAGEGGASAAALPFVNA